MLFRSNKKVRSSRLPAALRPRHGWRARAHGVRRELSLAVQRGLGLLRKKQPIQKMNFDSLVNLSAVRIRGLSYDEWHFLQPEAIAQWEESQLDAITMNQIRNLEPAQLEALAGNRHLDSDQIQRICIALSDRPDVGKLSLVMVRWQGDPMESRKIAIVSDTIISELTDPRAREILTVLSRAASDEQFHQLVTSVPFCYFKRLAFQEMQNPDPVEFERLALRVEERQFSNSYRVLRLTERIESIDDAIEQFRLGELKEIDPERRPWRSADLQKVRQLQELLRSGEQRREVTRILHLIKLEFAQHQIHLQTENSRIAGMNEVWEEAYLSQCESQRVLIERLIQPQFEVVQDIAGLLIEKGNGDLTEEERSVLLETLRQGIELAETMAPEVRKAEVILHQLKLDSEFLRQSEHVLMDQVRHESKLGRFSTEFFRRLLIIRSELEAYQILHGDEFEELLVQNKQLTLGIKLIEQVLELKSRVNSLHQNLHRALGDVSVDTLCDQMKRSVKLVEKR